MNRAELVSLGLGVVIGYFVVAHFLHTGKPA